MARWIWVLLLSGVLAAGASSERGDQKESQKKAPQTELHKRGEQKATEQGPEEVPPEEDESLTKKKEYAFNPLQAEKELSTGNFYYKKGSYRAAAYRYREATRWNEGYAEAWLKLGEAEEKQKDNAAAKEAYSKYLEVAPDAKNVPEIKKKLQKLK